VGGSGQHREGDAGNPDQTRGNGTPGDALGQQENAEPGHEQRLHRPEDRRHPAGQPVRGDEEQREEDADVERAEHRRLPPPGATRQPAGDGEEHEPGRQRPQHPAEQRPIGR
jgi:hypothetical protein